MNPAGLRIHATVCSALLVAAAGDTRAPAREAPLSTKPAQSARADTSRESAQVFREPALVKGSPTNLSSNYYFSRPGARGGAAAGASAASAGGVAVVNADTEQFVANIPIPGHSVAVNANNRHVFVPAAGRGIFVVAPGK